MQKGNANITVSSGNSPKLQRKSSASGGGEGVVAPLSSSPPPPAAAAVAAKTEEAAPEEKRFKSELQPADHFRSPESPLFSSPDVKPSTPSATQNGSSRFLDRFPFLSGASASDVFVSMQASPTDFEVLNLDTTEE